MLHGNGQEDVPTDVVNIGCFFDVEQIEHKIISHNTIWRSRHLMIKKMIHGHHDRPSSFELTSTRTYEVEHKYDQSDNRVIPATFKILPKISNVSRSEARQLGTSYSADPAG